ncbi:DUF2934 domain-containing protein [Devosia albogilva]|uniref:DUF2934 domain-containing protein n=1 Tax=Devosia albogilva TaxID=429726 RepID=A0ABW5QPG6_9HYPH
MEDRIKERAYQLWEADGRPEGTDQVYWFKAVAELAADTAKSLKPARKRPARTRKAA